MHHKTRKDKIKLPKDELCRLRFSGKTLREIGDIFNCSAATVAENFKEYNVDYCISRKIFNKQKGKLRAKDLSGQKFGYWLILERHIGNSNRVEWKCQCLKCNNIFIVTSTNLQSNHSKQCKQCRIKQLWGGYGGIPLTVWSTIARSAKRRNININITIKDIWDLLEKQNGKCALTGRTLVMCKNGKKRTASLDRIDSKLDYNIDNIQWIHKDLNNMKQCYTNEYFIKTCQEVTKYCENNNEIYKMAS